VRNPAALAAWGVRWVWLPDARYRGWKLRTLAQVDESVLCEVPGPVLSAYAPQQLIPITTRHAQDAIVAPHADPVRAAIVGDTLIPPGYQPGPTSVTVLRDEPTRLDVRVTSRGGTAVVATRCWSTCWHAAVDGVPVPTSVANLFLLAAPVPPGEHTVSFEYRVDLSTEARAAGAAWLLLLLALVAGLRRKGIA